MHVYRWDLDKTYLATEIESVRGLIRAALENAAEKRNVPGSASLLRALVAHAPDSRVCVLSGSPTQMRLVLEEKLRLDGIEIHELILKDNLGNLRRGRLRAVRDQLGYKLPNLLASRVGSDPSVRETLFGDDSEVDALVYAAYAEILSGAMTIPELKRLLKSGNAYPDAIDLALSSAERIRTGDSVDGIYIHVERGVPIDRFRLLGGRVRPVFSWLQAAMALEASDRLSRAHTIEVIRACTGEASLTEGALIGLVQDGVRRGLFTVDHARDVFGDPAFEHVAERVGRSLDRLRGKTDPPDRGRPDFLSFLRSG